MSLTRRLGSRVVILLRMRANDLHRIERAKVGLPARAKSELVQVSERAKGERESRLLLAHHQLSL